MFGAGYMKKASPSAPQLVAETVSLFVTGSTKAQSKVECTVVCNTLRYVKLARVFKIRYAILNSNF